MRNLKTLERFSKEQAGLVYDALYRAMCLAPPPLPVVPPPRLLDAHGQEEKPDTRIELKTFQVFLSEIATWARDDKIVRNGFQVSVFGLLGYRANGVVATYRSFDCRTRVYRPPVLLLGYIPLRCAFLSRSYFRVGWCDV